MHAAPGVYLVQQDVFCVGSQGSNKVQGSVIETKKSAVWEYFTPGENLATCQLCTRVVKRSRGNTSNLFAHMKSMHREHYDIMRDEDARLKNEVLNSAYCPQRDWKLVVVVVVVVAVVVVVVLVRVVEIMRDEDAQLKNEVLSSVYYL